MPDSAKPSRARWGARRVLTFALCAVAAAWLGRIVYRVVTATPAPIVDYRSELEALAARGQPEGRNGWDDLLTAIGNYEQIAGEIQEQYPSTFNPETGREVDHPDWDRLRAAAVDPEALAPELDGLERLRADGTLDTLDALATAPRFVRPLAGGASPLLMNLILPELTPLRGLARARAAAMRQAALAGDDAERVRAFEHILALARAMRHQTIIIDQLVGIAITAMAYEELRRQIAEAPMSEATARAFMDAIERQTNGLPGMELALEGERLSTRDTIQWMFTDDGHGDGRINQKRWTQVNGMAGGSLGSGLADALGAVTSRFLAGRKETTELFDEAYSGMADAARMRPDLRRTQGFDADAFIARLTWRHEFIRVLLPALGRVAEQVDRVEVDRALVRTALALEAHRARHGALPATLDALVPEFLDAVPVDPLNGGAFVYAPAPFSGAEGAAPPYTLYSMGIDGIHDIAAQGDTATGAFNEDGVDYVPEYGRE